MGFLTRVWAALSALPRLVGAGLWRLDEWFGLRMRPKLQVPLGEAARRLTALSERGHVMLAQPLFREDGRQATREARQAWLTDVGKELRSIFVSRRVEEHFAVAHVDVLFELLPSRERHWQIALPRYLKREIAWLERYRNWLASADGRNATRSEALTAPARGDGGAVDVTSADPVPGRPTTPGADASASASGSRPGTPPSIVVPAPELSNDYLEGGKAARYLQTTLGLMVKTVVGKKGLGAASSRDFNKPPSRLFFFHEMEKALNAKEKGLPTKQGRSAVDDRITDGLAVTEQALSLLPTRSAVQDLMLLGFLIRSWAAGKPKEDLGSFDAPDTGAVLDWIRGQMVAVGSPQPGWLKAGHDDDAVLRLKLAVERAEERLKGKPA